MMKHELFTAVAFSVYVLAHTGCERDQVSRLDNLLRERQLDRAAIVESCRAAGEVGVVRVRSALVAEKEKGHRQVLAAALLELDAAGNLDSVLQLVAAGTLDEHGVVLALVGLIDCDLRSQLMANAQHLRGAQFNVSVRGLAHVCDDDSCLSFGKRLLQDVPVTAEERIALFELLASAAYYNRDEATADLITPYLKSTTPNDRFIACVALVSIPGNTAEASLRNVCPDVLEQEFLASLLVERTRKMAQREVADGWKPSVRVGDCSNQATSP